VIQQIIRNILRSEPFDENQSDNGGWGRCFEDIVREGLAPAFYLQAKHRLLIPQNIIGRAKKAYEDALLYKDYAVCRLRELQTRLSSTGRIVIIKGLALCDSLYAEPLVRPMGDVDLYLPDGAVDDVKNILMQNGFSVFGTHETVFTFRELHIDLHTDLWGGRRIPLRTRITFGVKESFAQSTLVPGFFIPSPELLALHTAFHCLKHGFSRKIWYNDLLMLYKSGYFDTVISIGAFPFALFALEHLSDEGLIDDTIPAAGSMTGIKKYLLQKILLRNETAGMGEIALALLCPTVADSFAYCAGSLFPSKEILREMYGDRAYGTLLCRRVAALASYTMGALSWKKN
jgi:hypothetical protein